jgi:phage recombination protein Bet
MTNQIQNQNQNQLTTVDKKEMAYEVNGEQIKLTGQIVRTFLARGNKALTDPEVFMFMSLCKFQKLNPFLNEAYLVKFGDDCQIIVSKEAFMKRAEESELLDGIQAGIIVERDGKEVDVIGCFMRPADKLLGGWAKVYRSDRKYPYEMRVSFKEYDKGQSIWKTKPATMIRKVALVQTLREAFPKKLEGMYVEDEMPEANHDKVVERTIQQNANKELIDIDDDNIIPGEVIDVTPEPVTEQKPVDKKSKPDKPTEPEQVTMGSDPY